MTTLDPLKKNSFFFFNALGFLNILALSLWKCVKNWNFSDFFSIWRPSLSTGPPLLVVVAVSEILRADNAELHVLVTSLACV